MSKTPINTILKWLSVADMFVMIEYIPFTIYTTYIRPSKPHFLLLILQPINFIERAIILSTTTRFSFTLAVSIFVNGKFPLIENFFVQYPHEV